MAALMRSNHLKITENVVSLYMARQYSSRLKRSIQDIHTPESDAERMKHPKRIINPKKNPYLPYIPDDPVQKGMLHAVNNRERLGHSRQRTSKASQNETKTKPTHSPETVSASADTWTHSSEPLKSADGSLLSYTWVESNDPKIGNLILRARSKKYRHQEQEIIIEGSQAVMAAVKAGAKLKSLFFSGTDTLQKIHTEFLTDIPLYKIKYGHVKTCTQTDMPEGALGVFEMPEYGKALSQDRQCIPLTVVFNGIKEPRELGTLFHAASVVGCERIVTTKGCSDMWSLKALRTGGMSQFKVPIYDSIPWTKLESVIPSGDHVKVYITHAGYGEDNTMQDLKGSIEAVQVIDQMRNLELYEDEEEPHEDTVDQEHNDEDCFDENTVDFGNTTDIKDVNFATQKPNSHEKFLNSLPEDSSFEKAEGLEAHGNAPISVKECSEVDFVEGEHIVLVVSQGKGKVPLEAKKLAYDRCGEYLTLSEHFVGFDLKIASSIMMYHLGKLIHSKCGNRGDTDSL